MASLVTYRQEIVAALQEEDAVYKENQRQNEELAQQKQSFELRLHELQRDILQMTDRVEIFENGIPRFCTDRSRCK